MEDFETGTLALLTKHEDRLDLLEEKFNRLQISLVLALKQNGIDLANALTFVESRVPKLEVPVVVAEPALTANQKLKPSASGIIGVPSGNGGDGR